MNHIRTRIEREGITYVYKKKLKTEYNKQGEKQMDSIEIKGEWKKRESENQKKTRGKAMSLKREKRKTELRNDKRTRKSKNKKQKLTKTEK